MSLIHHVVAGTGSPAILFVHGFACGHADWAAQLAHLSGRHRTVAVDLRGHGDASEPPASICSIEQFGADIAAIVQALNLREVVLVGHSMGCRIVTEAAARIADRVQALIFVDASQLAAGMRAVLADAFAARDGYAALVRRWFQEMFTDASDPPTVAAAVERALRLPRPVGEKLLLDIARYDTEQFETALAALRVPVLAIQSTYSNERRERRSMRAGETTPFLDMLNGRTASLKLAIIEDTGHFPHIEKAAETNAAIDRFLALVTDTPKPATP